MNGQNGLRKVDAPAHRDPECAACGGTVEYHRNAAGDLYESCSHVGTHGRNDSAIRFVPERTA